MIFGSVSTVFLLLYTGCLCHPVHISQDVLKNVTMTPSAKETGYEKSPVVEKKGTIRISGPWHSDSALDRNIDLGEDSYVKKIISSNEGINFNKDMAEAGEMFDVNGIEDFYDKNAVVTYEVNGHEIPVHLKQKYTPQTKVMFPEYSRDSPATGAAIGKSNPPSPPVSESDGKKCRKSFSCLGGSSSSKLISSKSALRSGTRRGVQQSAPHSHRQSSIHSHSYDRILGNEDNAGEMKDHDIDNGREEVNHIKTADVRKSNEEEGETYKHEVDDQDFASHKHDNRNLPQRDILVDKEGEKLIPETIQKFKDAGKPFIMNTDSIDYKPKDDEDSDDEKDIENKISSPITSKNTNDPTGGIISKFSSKIRTGKSRTDQYHEIVENTDSFTKGKTLEDERTHVSDLGIKQGLTKKIDENEDTDVKSNEYSRESSQRKGRHHNHAFENDDSSRRGSDDDYFVIHARNKENDKTYQDDAHALEDNKNDKNVGRESSNHMSDQEGKAQGEESFAKTKLNEDKEAKEERDMRSHQTAAASEVFSPSHGHSFKDVDKGRDDKDSQVSKEDENPNKNHFMNEYEEGHRESTHENRNPEANSSQRSQGEKDQNRNDDKDSARDNQNQESLKEDRKKSNQRKIQSSESSQEYEDNPRHQKVSGEDAEKTNMKERDPKISYHRERNDEINDDSSKVSPSSHKNDAENSKDSGNNFKDSDTDIMEKHKVHDENESYKEKEVDSKESTNQVKEIGSSQKQSVSDLKEEQNEKGKEYPKKNMEQDSEASFSKNNDQDKSYDHGKEKYNIKDELKSSNVEPVTTKNDERNMKENLSKESSDAPMMTKMSENKEEYITTKQTDNSKKEDGHIADKTSATAESSNKIMKHESEDKNSGREKAMRLLEELNGEKDATPEKKPDTITQEGEVTYKATFHHDDQKESKSHHDEEHHDDHHDDHAYLSEKQENPSPDDSHHKSNESQQYSQSDHYGSQEAQHHQDQDSNHQEHGVENQGEMVSGGGSQANDEEKKVTGGGEVHKSFFSEGASRTESRKNGMISSRQEIGKEKEKERSFTPKTFPTEGKTEYPDYNEVRDAAVFETNLFRKNYHGNQLSWSEKLSDKAQQVADKIGKSFISDNGKQLDDFRHPGQNVALVKPNAANVGKDAVDSWSKESKDYDFKSPLVTKKNSDFVQLTWKNEKEFGLGVSKSIAGNGWVVVGMYDTPFDDRYQDLTSNVLPVKAVEDPYGDISG